MCDGSLRLPRFRATLQSRRRNPARSRHAADRPQVCLLRCPVVDLAPAWSGDASARAALADEIAEVCGRVGFMYIKNHRIADPDVAAIFNTAADFHNLPLETKMESSIARNADAQGQGYLHGMTKGNAKNISENLQEAFQFRRPLAEDDPGLLAGQAAAWPDSVAESDA